MKSIFLTILFLSNIIFKAPEKKNVLIIGDSISIGYFPFVKEALKDANVEHNKGNAQHTGTGLDNIDSWLQGKHWDVIHFNWGLWDLCYRNPESKTQGNRDKINGKITFTPQQYEANLRSLVSTLKKTGAKLIFATTSMVPSKEEGRIVGDEKIYNTIALKIMKENGIEINDLNKISYKIHEQNGLGENDVHYNKEGYKQLAQPVIQSIEKALKIEDKSK